METFGVVRCCVGGSFFCFVRPGIARRWQCRAADGFSTASQRRSGSSPTSALTRMASNDCGVTNFPSSQVSASTFNASARESSTWAANVDLNPIRAVIAKTIEQRDFTSAQKRAAELVSRSGDRPKRRDVEAPHPAYRPPSAPNREKSDRSML